MALGSDTTLHSSNYQGSSVNARRLERHARLARTPCGAYRPSACKVESLPSLFPCVSTEIDNQAVLPKQNSSRLLAVAADLPALTNYRTALTARAAGCCS